MARGRTLNLKVQAEVKGADKVDALGKKFQRAGKNLTVGVTVPLIAAAAGLVKLADAQEKAEAEMTRAFRSMGASAWTTTDALKAQASALQEATTFGDEEILHLQSVLLTFGNVTGSAFDRATASALDMSAALGTDTQSAAIQLGKALNDPIKGLTALTRVGVSFTKAQQEQIRSMADAGDVMGAQGIILSELERQFGGAAEALAGTTGGKLKQAFNALGDAGEEFGAIIAPMLVDVANGVKDFAKWLQRLNPETQRFIIFAGAAAAALGPVLFIFGSMLRVIAPLVTLFPKVVAGMRAVGIAAHAMLGPLGLVTGAVSLLATGFATDFLGMRTRFEKDMADIGDFLGDLGRDIGDFFSGTADDADKALERVPITADRHFEAYTRVTYDHMQAARGMVNAGVAGMAAEMEEAPEKMADALLAEQFKPLADAINELNEFTKQAVSPAVEIFRAQGYLNSDEYANALGSDNPLVVQKAEELAAQAREALARNSAYNSGKSFSDSFAYGMTDRGALRNVLNSAYKVTLAARGIFPGSEPKDPRSPLRGITRAWGMMDTLADGIRKTGGAVPMALAGALATPNFGTSGAPRRPAIVPGMGNVTNINLTVEGDLRAKSPEEVVQTLQHLSPFVDGNLAPGW